MFKKIHRSPAMGSKRVRLPDAPGSAVFGSVVALLSLLFIAMGCRTAGPFPSVNVQEAGWKVRHGQGLWKANATAPEIACDLTVATHSREGTLIELTKNPFPLVVARVTPHRWQLEFPAKKRTVAGSGPVPAKLRWPRHRVPLAVLQLVNLLNRQPAPHPWKFVESEARSFRIENTVTHESLEGFLDNPVSHQFFPLPNGKRRRVLMSALPCHAGFRE